MNYLGFLYASFVLDAWPELIVVSCAEHYIFSCCEIFVDMLHDSFKEVGMENCMALYSLTKFPEIFCPFCGFIWSKLTYGTLFFLCQAS